MLVFFIKKKSLKIVVFFICSDEHNIIRIKKMDILDKIGKGSYGTVYRCRSGGRDFALKIMPFEFELTYFEANMVSILRELWAISSRHCGIKKLGVVYFPRGVLYRFDIKTCEDNICEPYVMGIGIALKLGDFTLSSLIARKEFIPRRIVANIVTQLIQKLFKLHCDLNCIHRDLKPGNIVMSMRNNVLSLDIIDYGMLTFREKSNNPGVTTSSYRAPEIFLRSEYDNKADIWSLGTIVFELLTLTQFCDFKASEPEDSVVLACIWKRLGKPSIGDIAAFDTVDAHFVLGEMSLPPTPDLELLNSLARSHSNAPDELDDLVLSCLQLDPEKRPSIVSLSKLNFLSYEASKDKIESMDYLVKLTLLCQSPKVESSKKVLTPKEIGLFFGESTSQPTTFSKIKVYDEKNTRIAISSGIMKAGSRHSFPDSFLWNCLMICDALICDILETYSAQHVVFTRTEADIFACATCFICAAPFEEQVFVLKPDFLVLFALQDEQAVMRAVIDILKRCDFTLTTFAEYRGKTNSEINSYSSERCRDLVERFCEATGSNSWLHSLGMSV